MGPSRSPSSTPRPTGRRPGAPDTRGDILDSARKLFSEKGFAGASVRAIAADAGVDAALVHHYFGSKQSLFRAALAMPVDPAQIAARLLTGDIDTLPERLVSTFLGIWESPETGPAMIAMVRSAVATPEQSQAFESFLSATVLDAAAGYLAERYDRAEAQQRVMLTMSHLIGVGVARYIVRVAPLAAIPVDRLAAMLTPVTAHFILGDLDEIPTSSTRAR